MTAAFEDILRHTFGIPLNYGSSAQILISSDFANVRNDSFTKEHCFVSFRQNSESAEPENKSTQSFPHRKERINVTQWYHGRRK